MDSAIDHDGWVANNLDPAPPGSPTQDPDNKLILQKVGGGDEDGYNLPSSTPNRWANHRIWFDRDGEDQWQAKDSSQNNFALLQVNYYRLKAGSLGSD